MPSEQYDIIERPPTVLEHQTLWEAVGWGSVDITMSEQSIANSIYCIVATSKGHVVGMGPIVGE